MGVNHSLQDATPCISNYDGAVKKSMVRIDGEYWMIKFGEEIEANPKRPMQGSYCNTPVSEWLGCHIFEQCGIPVQETFLDTYRGQTVVACRDFILNDPRDVSLLPFSHIENTMYSSSKRVAHPQYETLDAVMHAHGNLSGHYEEARDRYWETFVIDALIGNFDRHGGNWGYLLDKENQTIVDLAPVYDCGSCLSPSISRTGMKEMLSKPKMMSQRAVTFPKAALELNHKKLSYAKTLVSPELGIEARKALGRLEGDLMQMDWESIIDEQSFIDDLHKEFLKATLCTRFQEIIEPALNLVHDEQNHDKDEIG